MPKDKTLIKCVGLNMGVSLTCQTLIKACGFKTLSLQQLSNQKFGCIFKTGCHQTCLELNQKRPKFNNVMPT